MSSRHSKRTGKGKGKEKEVPTAWSEFAWDEEHGKWMRYRMFRPCHICWSREGQDVSGWRTWSVYDTTGKSRRASTLREGFRSLLHDPTEESQECSKPSILINVYTNRITEGAQGDLIQTIVQKLWKNPSLLPGFMELYHGDYDAVDVFGVDSKPVVDTFLIERVIALNAFGCPLSTYDDHWKYSKGLESEKYQHHSTGVWLMASAINHSCLSNCRRSFIGDLQFIRATCDIPAGTELTF